MGWWNGFERYDRIDTSKVLTFTPDFDTAIDARESVTGWQASRDLEYYRDHDG